MLVSPHLTNNASSSPANSSRMRQQLRGMYISPHDQQRLIFPGKQLKDTSKSWGNMCPPLPDQQRLIFTTTITSNLLHVHYSMICQIKVGESTRFKFQGNKLLEVATNLNARHANFNHASGGQSIVDCRVDTNTVVVIENVAISSLHSPTDPSQSDAD